MSTRDNYYAHPIGEIPDFSFNAEVVRVFDDMIQRSVPGYASVISLTGQLAARFAAEGDTVYDLGCSTGASLFAMRQNVSANTRLIGLDTSEAMLEKCRENLAQQSHGGPVELIETDITQYPFESAAFFSMNFTLQFVEPSARELLLSRIAQSTRPGGALVLSEKIQFENPIQQSLHTDMHHDFKRRQGYSELEISQKRAALENVMLPETLDTHRRRLKGAGFASAEVWFQCFNFVSLVAIR